MNNDLVKIFKDKGIWSHVADGQIDKFEEIDARNSSRTSPHLIWMSELEDDSTVVMPSNDLSTGIITWARALNDYEAGLALLAGQPNHGKSSTIISLVNGLLSNNDDVFVLDFSFDDPDSKRFVQLVSNMSGLPYQKVYSGGLLSETERKIKEEAKQKIYQYIREQRYMFCSPIQQLRLSENKRNVVELSSYRIDELLMLFSDVRKALPDKKIVAFIDAFNDISTEDAGQISLFDQAVRRLKTASNNEGIKAFATCHLKKVDNRVKGQFTADDIKGSKELEFSTLWLSILYNDYREHHGKTGMVITRDGMRYPVISISNKKSKVSAWTDEMLYAIDNSCCRLLPLTREEYIAMVRVLNDSRNPDKNKK